MKTKYLFIIAALAMLSLGQPGCSSCKHVIKEKRVTKKEGVRVLSDQERPLSDWVKCATCDGKGTCSNCKGKGKINGRNCQACNGTGKCNICGGEGGHRSE